MLLCLLYTRSAALALSVAALCTAAICDEVVAVDFEKKTAKGRLQLGFEPRTSSTQMRNANHYTTEADQAPCTSFFYIIRPARDKNPKIFMHATCYPSGTWYMPGVCVLHTKPFFLFVDIQHIQCPCRFFVTELCSFKNHGTTQYQCNAVSRLDVAMPMLIVLLL